MRLEVWVLCPSKFRTDIVKELRDPKKGPAPWKNQDTITELRFGRYPRGLSRTSKIAMTLFVKKRREICGSPQCEKALNFKEKFFPEFCLNQGFHGVWCRPNGVRAQQTARVPYASPQIFNHKGKTPTHDLELERFILKPGGTISLNPGKYIRMSLKYISLRSTFQRRGRTHQGLWWNFILPRVRVFPTPKRRAIAI